VGFTPYKSGFGIFAKPGHGFGAYYLNIILQPYTTQARVLNLRGKYSSGTAAVYVAIFSYF